MFQPTQPALGPRRLTPLAWAVLVVELLVLVSGFADGFVRTHQWAGGLLSILASLYLVARLVVDPHQRRAESGRWAAVSVAVGAVAVGLATLVPGGLHVLGDALAEEVVFRLLVADALYVLVRRHRSETAAQAVRLVGSSAAFALLPGHLEQLPLGPALLVFTLAGFTLGASRWLSGALLPAVTWHGAANVAFLHGVELVRVAIWLGPGLLILLAAWPQIRAARRSALLNRAAGS